MVRLISAASEQTFFCPHCKKVLPLSSYRLLYHDTRRTLRCLECEIGLATTKAQKSALKYFSRLRISKRQYDLKHPDKAKDRRVRSHLLHPDNIVEYRRAYYVLNRNEIIDKVRAWAEQHNERRRENYKQWYSEVRAPRERAERRKRVREAVARLFGISPEELLYPYPGDHYMGHARSLTIYRSAIPQGRYNADNIPETALEYNCQERDVHKIIRRVQCLLEQKNTSHDGQWYSDVLEQIRIDLGRSGRRARLAS
jgi:hypothetical protein